MTCVLTPYHIKKMQNKKFGLKDLTIKHAVRVKTAFYASDFGKADLDLYFSFVGEPQTNPAQWPDTLKWGAGNGVEASLLQILKDSGIVDEHYNQRKHGRIDIERAGIKIHGYMDAVTKWGVPIEIKSIDNKNFYGIGEYAKGKPREGYVGQLGIYMDALGVDVGYLFVSSIDGYNYFLFKAVRLKNNRIKCGKVTVDLNAFYARCNRLYNDHIVPRTMPDIWQYVYKHPVDKIDWANVSKSDISKARTNKKVIGDWQVQWSSWKNRIVALQKTKLGYSNKELAYILKATKGYSSKKKWKKS